MTGESSLRGIHFVAHLTTIRGFLIIDYQVRAADQFINTERVFCGTNGPDLTCEGGFTVVTNHGRDGPRFVCNKQNNLLVNLKVFLLLKKPTITRRNKFWSIFRRKG